MDGVKITRRRVGLGRGFFIFLLLPFFFLPKLSVADAVNREWLSTTRALSMGNIGIASADDASTAMFYNPAALSSIKKGGLEILSPQIEMGLGNFKLVKSPADYTKQASLSNTIPLLRQQKGVVSSLNGSIYPNFTAQNFAFGILARAEGASFAKGGGTVEYQSKYYIIPTMGVAIGALSGRFKMGFGFRMIQATENFVSTTDTSSAGYRANAREGLGMGLDVGTMLTMPWSGLPTVALVARNMGDTTLKRAAFYKIGMGATTQHEKVKMTFDGGVSLSPSLGKRSVINFAVDFRDMRNVNKVDLYRRINTGVEFGIHRILFLRMGYGRGYWTAGIGFNSKTGSLDLGTYSEEMSATKINGQQDRRVSLRLGQRF